ncbi:MAG: hypothetical protein AB1778_02750 [Candidatus Bipolaricaulota bacterium]
MSSRLTQDDARALALELTRGTSDPVVRLRLARDVLRGSAGEERVDAARREVDTSIHVERLIAEQRPDGGWGRLHSRDTSSRSAVPTTEWAVERALALGLDARHPILAKAVRYLADVLAGRAVPPDPPERNDRWTTGLQLFAASALARIEPGHEALDVPWRLWQEIARRTLSDGSYDAAAEAEAHHALTGATVTGSYLVLSNRYTLALLAARAADLPDGLAASLVRWIWRKPDGIGCYGVPVSAPVQTPDSGAGERWFLSHELLAGFSVAGMATAPLADALAERRRPDGLWDFGPRAAWSWALPLSESWRRRDARAVDWTVRVLALLGAWRTRTA